MKFFVETIVRNHNGGTRRFSFILNGGSTIDHVCDLSFSKLRENGWLSYEPFGCVFETVEDAPLLIPSGTLLGEVYLSNPSPNGTGVELWATVVEERKGCNFIISPGDDFILGNWMTGFMAQ
ncbi:uncharacterized protein LOC119307674 [Triticum dicoccoides]|uniref:uncharacterized protein LOC119307674 n=1 Tax=Triticum dicoccoides TaxID=85692 RepID=UPI000E7C6708|nr:uncharacterized protein LOC119307674 [Triticum dicoccoides]XP_037439633.1 uncharacterized protein LOC119307674 [Triticum dicoccoides]XP_037439634.1 uncharacterized protein LOC119307674 [Triticum dicoccoides]XP_037439635.1 uncharacterized protein LOC119307674 [Triticum dicoccoides]